MDRSTKRGTVVVQRISRKRSKEELVLGNLGPSETFGEVCEPSSEGVADYVGVQRPLWRLEGRNWRVLVIFLFLVRTVH